MKREQIEKYFIEYLLDEDGEETDEKNPDYIESDITNVGDNALEGLNLIGSRVKATGRRKQTVLEGANHDIIYSLDIDDALEILTEEDFKALAKLNWMLDDESDCLSCFV